MLSRYDASKLDQIIDILSRAAEEPPDIVFQRLDKLRDDLEMELLTLIHSTGLAHEGSEVSAIWHHVVCSAPSHQQLAAGFKAMAKATNPLDASVCKPDLWPDLNALIRTRWAPRRKRERRNSEPSLRTLDWDGLSVPERKQVSDMARHLAQYHGSFVRRGRPQKGNLDAAMAELADIFLRYSGSSKALDEVPYARESQFIKFAVLALEPAAEYFEVSDYALSRRWERRVLKARPRPRRDSAKKVK